MNAALIEADRSLSPAELRTLVATYTDVAERLRDSHEKLQREVKRLHADLERKDRELERRQRLAALGQMAAGLAHEIRNPLGSILLYASMLEKDLADHDKQANLAHRITSGVRTLEGLVTDILAFAGNSAPRLLPIVLDGVIEDALTIVDAKLGADRATIEIDAAVRGVEVLGDTRQLRSALSNLLLNAAEAAGETGWVRLSRVGGNGGRRVRLAIADNGPGIDETHLDQIFNPFFTSKPSGVGLGLAIVHRIAESHGGRVWACNRTEGGAEMVLELPTPDAANASAERSETHRIARG